MKYAVVIEEGEKAMARMRLIYLDVSQLAILKKK